LQERSLKKVLDQLSVPLYRIEFWSAMQTLVDLTDAVTGTDVALPSITMEDTPSTATIVRAQAFLSFGEVRDGSGAENKLNGVQYIQVKKNAGGTWTNAITLPDDCLRVDANGKRGGAIIAGDLDVASEIDTINVQIDFQWASSLVDGNDLQLLDVQTGLFVWYTI